MYSLHKSDIRNRVIKSFLFQLLFKKMTKGPVSSQSGELWLRSNVGIAFNSLHVAYSKSSLSWVPLKLMATSLHQLVGKNSEQPKGCRTHDAWLVCSSNFLTYRSEDFLKVFWTVDCYKLCLGKHNVNYMLSSCIEWR